MTRPLSAKAARAITAAATIVKAPDWADTRNWHVTSGGKVLAVIEPSYSGTGRRNGWRPRLPDSALYASRPEPTREKAAVAGLLAWERRATARPRS